MNFSQHDILDRYDNVNVDVMYKPGWFLERNPLGKVPTIQVSDKPDKRRSKITFTKIFREFTD